MSSHMSDADYSDLLRLVLLEADGVCVKKQMERHAPSHIHWMREWSMILGYIEMSGFGIGAALLGGLDLPAPKLTERGRVKLVQIEHLS
jgi:hypothetical protein